MNNFPWPKHSRYLLLLTVSLMWANSVNAVGQEPVEIPNSLLKIIRSVKVPSSTEGIISNLNVGAGDMVSAGDSVARIEQESAKLVKEAAKFEYEVAKAKVENNIDIRYARKAHEVAKADLKRGLDSNSKVRGTISKGEIDHRGLVVERTKLEIEQAERNDRIETLNLSLKENAVAQQDLFLEKHEIKAPIGGMVVAVPKAEGEWANASETLVRIVNIDRLRVEDFVPVEVALEGIKGNRVTFRPSLPQLGNRSFQGEVVFVSPEANSLDSKVRIWAEIENTDRQLRPGLKGTLTIHRQTDPSIKSSNVKETDQLEPRQ